MGGFIPNLLPILLRTIFHMVFDYIPGLFASDHIFLEM